MGTRAGYIIRYTCPSCHTENAIINKTPKDFYKKIRDARCHNCKKCSTVMTHGSEPETGISFRVNLRNNEKNYNKPLAPSISSME